MTHKGGLVFQTFDVVKQYPWILHILFHLHMFNKIYWLLEGKYFVFGLPREPTVVDIFEAWMIFECHSTNHRTHSTTNKHFEPIQKLHQSGEASIECIHDNLKGRTC